jgi:hypothetical protein
MHYEKKGGKNCCTNQFTVVFIYISIDFHTMHDVILVVAKSDPSECLTTKMQRLLC